MYTMKEVCRETGMTYEALKFYCNEGLVPNVKRDTNNHHLNPNYQLQCQLIISLIHLVMHKSLHDIALLISH